MVILMCKNTPIYDIANDAILRPDLCPVDFTKVAYTTWKKKRQFLKTNRVAAATVARADSIDKRISKRRLSLSDCYWVRYDYDSDTAFEDISPYYTEFLAYESGRQGSSVPDATLGGSFQKNWFNHEGFLVFQKQTNPKMVCNEMAALALAHRLDVDANQGGIKIGEKSVITNAFQLSQVIEDNSIYIENITSPEKMLLPISWTTPTRTNVSRGHDVMRMRLAYKGILDDSVAKDFIVRTILFDAIVVNDDRRVNMSNWGYYKDPDTGVCSPAPLYDFNLAHLDEKTWYLPNILKSLKSSDDYVKIARGYLESWEQGIKDFGAEKWVENWEALACAIKH
jgi:hypothetical protein